MPEQTRNMIDDLAGLPGGITEGDADQQDPHADIGGDLEGDDAVIRDLLVELKKFDIILPEDDTTAENFLERLQVGLKTAAAHQGLNEQLPSDGSVTDNETQVADAGGVAMMSLQARNAFHYAEGQHRSSVQAALDSLLRTGRCTPAEHHQQGQLVQAVRLSLDNDAKPIPSELERWIASRQPLPCGACWDPQERSTRMGVEVEDLPDSLAGKESDAKVNAVLQAVFGPRK